MSLPREGSRDTGEGILVSMTPDVCRTPNGPATPPIPYSIWAKQNDAAAATAATVRQTGMTSHTSASLITLSHGDAPGVGGGVKSGTVGSICQPRTWSSSVRFEGKNAVRHDDLWWMNRKNCHGQLTYLKDTKIYDPTPDIAGAKPLTEQDLAQAEQSLKDGDSLQIPGDHVAQLGWSLRRAIAVPGIRRPGPLPPPPIVLPKPDGAPASRSRPSEDATSRDGTRTTEKDKEDKCPCKLGRYGDLKTSCKECGDGYQAHHIIPDYTLRYGTRAEGVAGLKRIPGVPSFNDGPSICLKGQAGMSDTDHHEAHLGDKLITDKALDYTDLGKPIGTIEFRTVKTISVSAVQNIVTRKDPVCAFNVGKMVDDAFDKVPHNKLLRGLQPLPIPPALDALRQGALYPWKPAP